MRNLQAAKGNLERREGRNELSDVLMLDLRPRCRDDCVNHQTTYYPNVYNAMKHE